MHVMYVQDPDILVGYEVQNASIGYLIARGKKIDINVLQELSRIPSEPPPFLNENDVYGRDEQSGNGYDLI